MTPIARLRKELHDAEREVTRLRSDRRAFEKSRKEVSETLGRLIVQLTHGKLTPSMATDLALARKKLDAL